MVQLFIPKSYLSFTRRIMKKYSKPWFGNLKWILRYIYRLQISACYRRNFFVDYPYTRSFVAVERIYYDLFQNIGTYYKIYVFCGRNQIFYLKVKFWPELSQKFNSNEKYHFYKKMLFFRFKFIVMHFLKNKLSLRFDSKIKYISNNFFFNSKYYALNQKNSLIYISKFASFKLNKLQNHIKFWWQNLISKFRMGAKLNLILHLIKCNIKFNSSKLNFLKSFEFKCLYKIFCYSSHDDENWQNLNYLAILNEYWIILG